MRVYSSLAIQVRIAAEEIHSEAAAMTDVFMRHDWPYRTDKGLNKAASKLKERLARMKEQEAVVVAKIEEILGQEGEPKDGEK